MLTPVKFMNLGQPAKIECLVARAGDWARSGGWPRGRVLRLRTLVQMYRRDHAPEATVDELLQAFVGIAQKRASA